MGPSGSPLSRLPDGCGDGTRGRIPSQAPDRSWRRSRTPAKMVLASPGSGVIGDSLPNPAVHRGPAADLSESDTRSVSSRSARIATYWATLHRSDWDAGLKPQTLRSPRRLKPPRLRRAGARFPASSPIQGPLARDQAREASPRVLACTSRLPTRAESLAHETPGHTGSPRVPWQREQRRPHKVQQASRSTAVEPSSRFRAK